MWEIDGIKCIIISVFFFQAEDGIRDLVRSRGLGDVYKRQVLIMGLLCVVYCTIGGIEAVIWSDVVQSAVLAGGTLLLTVTDPTLIFESLAPSGP